MVGPDNPEHKLVFAVPLFLALGLFAGRNSQDFAKDLFGVRIEALGDSRGAPRFTESGRNLDTFKSGASRR